MVIEAPGRAVAAASRISRERVSAGIVHAAPQPHPIYAPAARCIDILLALALLVFALPLLLAASLAILLMTRRAPLLR
jgi:lipopolysaccharide/colanic/teichoic acid biosynthesis glycosyltransferase